MPFGLEREKPRHYRAIAEALWQNRSELGYAADLMRQGVCDGCALGPRGLADDVVEGAHLCEIRLSRLRSETMDLAPPADLLNIKRLRSLDAEALEGLGRLGHPYLYRRGDRGFSHLSWERALALLGERPAIAPERLAFLAGSARLSNEAAYTAGKAARLLGTPHVDLWGRAEHVAALEGLHRALGMAAATASLSDLADNKKAEDIVVLDVRKLSSVTDFFVIASGTSEPHLRAIVAAEEARGTRVVMVGPALVEAQLSYWSPAEPLSALFGSSAMDDFILVRPGGEAALLTGALKAIMARDALNRDFISRSTTGWEALAEHLDGLDWPTLEEASGADTADMAWLGELFSRASTAVTVYGDDPHSSWADKVQAIVNIHLARGQIGAPKAGILPLVGHAGVIGGVDCGLSPGLTPPGYSASQQLDAATRGELDLLYTLGGDLLDPERLAEPVSRVALHIHQASALSPVALLEPGELTLLLPSQTRHEQLGGASVTSVERRIRLSPEIPNPPPQGARRPDWMIPGLVAGALNPATAGALTYPDGAAVRRDLAEAVPRYAGIERLNRAGDWVQWGGPQLYTTGEFPALPEGRARFEAVLLGAP